MTITFIDVQPVNHVAAVIAGDDGHIGMTSQFDDNFTKVKSQCGAPGPDGGRVFFNFSRKKAGQSFNESGRILSMN